MVRGAGAGADGGDWLECRSNESANSDYDYKFEEDPDQMIVKKYKRKRGEGGLDMDDLTSATMTIKEPFLYQEEVLYPTMTDPRHTDQLNRSVYDVLLPEMSQIMPFGYPTEQFIRGLKQDIHDKLEQSRMAMRSGDDEDVKGGSERDPGMIEHDTGMFQDINVNAWGVP